MFLVDSGTEMVIRYKKRAFGRVFEMKMSIDQFKAPTGDKFGLWNIYELPDDLNAYIIKDRL